MKVRECRICGEWKSIKEHFSYGKSERDDTYCRECYKTRSSYGRAYQYFAAKWTAEMREKWNFIPRKPNPDREILILSRDIPSILSKHLCDSTVTQIESV